MSENSRRINAQAESLLARMTLEEKVGQMVQIPCNMLSWDEAREWAKRGAGSFLHVLGDKARELQGLALETRLGIPAIFGIDAIHGHGLNDKATIFPSQLAAACSWNPERLREMGEVTAREVSTDGLHWTFSPVLCLGRDTRWGRIDETFGEDPYLTGELGASMVKGYQGKSLDTPDSILACAKHYIGYGEAVGGRDSCDTQITFRKMREVFLPPFKKALDAGCATVMTAYGSIDGTPLTSSKRALKTVLRDELGFDGLVVTDWDNVQSLVENQRTAGDIGEASKMAAEAGNDMIMTSWDFYGAALEMVKSGKLEESVIDEAALHILTIKFRMGLFEHPEKRGRPGCFGCREHLEAARNTARESIVLLKNEKVLPLTEKVKSIAVIGPNSDDIRAQYGDWAYFTHPLPNPDREPKRPYVTVREGVEAIAAEHGIDVSYARGCGAMPDDRGGIDEAVEAASGRDAIILVLGDCIGQHGEGRDRANLDLPASQMELFRRLRELDIPVITVLVSSKPLCIGEAAEKSDALIIAFNGGMFGGQAVAETVFGKINPSGHLPISFPRHSGQIPVYYNYLPGWHWGQYMDLPETPLFTFGEGLSYTRFEYSSLRFDTTGFKASVDIKNTGDRQGVTVCQLYFRDCVSSVMTPVKQLIAFRRVSLEAGESKTLEFGLERDAFSLVTPDEKRVTEPGDFILMAGSSSRDEDVLSLQFTLE